MTSSGAATESALIDRIRPRLHHKLRLLFDESSRCLPILQSTCQQILNHVGPQSSAVSLAQVISHDHGLTCKVLQVANSIAYSPQQTIVSIPHAVSWLGLDTVSSLVAAAHLVEQLQHWPVRQQEFRTLIAKSLISATYASELGVAIGYPQPGQLFTGTSYTRSATWPSPTRTLTSFLPSRLFPRKPSARRNVLLKRHA